jgi:urease alpha subunit
VPVVNTRAIGTGSMRNNGALPKVEVDPQTYEVFADGELLTCEPAQPSTRSRAARRELLNAQDQRPQSLRFSLCSA